MLKGKVLGIIKSVKGKEFEWPIRFEAVLTKECDHWVFKYLQLSYPTNIILEGKTDAAEVIA